MHVIAVTAAAELTTVSWTDKRLARITSLCLYAETGTSWYDVLHCRGELRDGSVCGVRLPFEQLQKGLERITIVRHAKTDHVFATGLKVLESVIYLANEHRAVQRTGNPRTGTEAREAHRIAA